MITTAELRKMREDAVWEFNHLGAPGCTARVKAFRRLQVFTSLINARTHGIVTIKPKPGEMSEMLSSGAADFLFTPDSEVEKAPDVWPGDEASHG